MRFLLYGFGVMNQMVASCVAKTPHKIVGVVDSDEKKVGKNLTAYGLPFDVVISPSLHNVPIADVAIHATGSSLDAVVEQIVGLFRRGMNVVSSCEELSYPFENKYFQYLATNAYNHHVLGVGSGVNPGFAMDALPLSLAPVLHAPVVSAEIVRQQDASNRRRQFVEKIGTGLCIDEFHTRVKSGKLCHVGLRESCRIVADALGMKPYLVSEETIEPIIAEQEHNHNGTVIPAGRVLGVTQSVEAYTADEKKNVLLVFNAALGLSESFEQATFLLDDRTIYALRTNGIHGDKATAARLVSTALGVYDLWSHGKCGIITPDKVPVKYIF